MVISPQCSPVKMGPLSISPKKPTGTKPSLCFSNRLPLINVLKVRDWQVTPHDHTVLAATQRPKEPSPPSPSLSLSVFNSVQQFLHPSKGRHKTCSISWLSFLLWPCPLTYTSGRSTFGINNKDWITFASSGQASSPGRFQALH